MTIFNINLFIVNAFNLLVTDRDRALYSECSGYRFIDQSSYLLEVIKRPHFSDKKKRGERGTVKK